MVFSVCYQRQTFSHYLISELGGHELCFMRLLFSQKGRTLILNSFTYVFFFVYFMMNKNVVKHNSSFYEIILFMMTHLFFSLRPCLYLENAQQIYKITSNVHLLCVQSYADNVDEVIQIHQKILNTAKFKKS